MYNKIKYFLIAAISSIGFGCNKDYSSFTLIYYQDNKSSEVKFEEKRDREEIAALIKELVYNSTDMLKLLVLPERIVQLKEKESAIEILFPDDVYLQTKDFGNIKVRKVLLPLSGDFIGNSRDPVTTVFYGEKEYSSGPLRNSRGYPLLQRILEKVKGKISR